MPNERQSSEQKSANGSADSVICPICSASVPASLINDHLDAGCSDVTRAVKTRNPASSPGEQPLASIFTQKRRPSSPPSSTPSAPSGASPAKRARTNQPVSQPSASTSKSSTNSNLLSAQPLAERLRPLTLDHFVGQEDVVGPGTLLRGLLEKEGNKGVGSCVLWGPPGSGKTTLARLLARTADATFKELSATSSGTADVRAIFEEAKNLLKLTGRPTILFLDEIQRFNKAQQDLFLPYVENGWIQLIAATTENPSFKVNGALLSRCRLFILSSLSADDIYKILTNALDRLSKSTTEGESPVRQVPDTILKRIAHLSAGDARTALSALELVLSAPGSVSEEQLMESVKRSVVARYDRTGDDRYDLISALHKSLRGSDASASMYWLARMLTGGEDPLYVARRLIVVASEDVGLANERALPLAVATYNACQMIGMPECRINLAHCVAYLAESPKSTRSYEAYNRAEAAAKADTTLPVPYNIRNAPTKLMKELGYGRGYNYNPSFAHPVHNDFLPMQLKGERFMREDGEGKAWVEEELRRWEWLDNGGKNWEGRSRVDPSQFSQMGCIKHEDSMLRTDSGLVEDDREESDL